MTATCTMNPEQLKYLDLLLTQSGCDTTSRDILLSWLGRLTLPAFPAEVWDRYDRVRHDYPKLVIESHYNGETKRNEWCVQISGKHITANGIQPNVSDALSECLQVLSDFERTRRGVII